MCVDAGDVQVVPVRQQVAVVEGEGSRSASPERFHQRRTVVLQIRFAMFKKL